MGGWTTKNSPQCHIFKLIAALILKKYQNNKSLNVNTTHIFRHHTIFICYERLWLEHGRRFDTIFNVLPAFRFHEKKDNSN